ncbi:delta(24(24(1)))-sterol reductase [Purpureocillium lavendulum]|uniref:Delta(24(24(1)))-sterol reductase n=1 Tax=Purpureocillium lavendulum TaxID=1247861 RepID=A0AB34FNQ1_9HYPO|nr:delta(24(24(1)))-sterol reductase [Purpureocillium lavendulum]
MVADFVDVAACLRPGSIIDRSSGVDIVDCLKRGLPNSCTKVLPDVCLSLRGLTIGVLPKAEQCVKRLGCFVGKEVVDCVKKPGANGNDILACVFRHTGLPDPKAPGACKPEHTCVTTELPKDCMAMRGVNGFHLQKMIPLCHACIGWAENRVSSCLNLGKNIINASGDDLIKCMLKKLNGVCISKLPLSCLNLKESSSRTYPPAIRQCQWDLGPFVTPNVRACLTISQGPEQVINCLNVSLQLRK